MKKIFIGALAILSLTGVAQNKIKKIKPVNAQRTTAAIPPSSYYSFSTFTASYQSIAGTTITPGAKWDEPTDTIPVGFNFKLYNAQNDTIFFEGGAIATFNDINNDPLVTLASPILEDLCDKAFDPNNDNEGDPGGVSNISYTTTGTAGNRICKIQVNNAGFYGENDANGTSVSSITFQLWLYETSNDIEFRFGSVNILNPSLNLANTGGFICGLVDQLDFNTITCANSNMLNGPNAGPTMVALTTAATEFITGNPQSGRVYKFTRNVTTAIKTIANTNNLTLYPNPAKDKLYIGNINSELENATIEFYDVTGKQIHSEKIKSELDLSGFNKGVYFVKLKTENNQSSFINKLVITE